MSNLPVNSCGTTGRHPTEVTPTQYESLVAADYRRKGYEATCTPSTNDYGVDVFATKGADKLAIQAKMYDNGGRPVNRDMVMHLHGAKDWFDCTKAIIVTTGQVRPDAMRVARKLGIDIVQLSVAELLSTHSNVELPPPSYFDDIWQRHIMPLAGKAITSPNGLTNTVLSVDWTGLERQSSGDKRSHIPIEVFRTAVNHILCHGSITRSLINEQYAKRGSSAVVLVLSQVPSFEYTTAPQGLRLRPDGVGIGTARCP